MQGRMGTLKAWLTDLNQLEAYIYRMFSPVIDERGMAQWLEYLVGQRWQCVR